MTKPNAIEAIIQQLEAFLDRPSIMPTHTIKICVSDQMLTQLNRKAETEGMPRSEFIRRTLAGELHPLRS